MELIGRMLDGSISYDSQSGLEPSSSGLRQDDKIDRLEDVSLFQGCSRRQLRHIARIAETFDAPAGMPLARVGEAGNQFFLILDGTARVEVSPEKQTKLHPGDYFGEMSLLDGEPRSATVVAETPMRVLVISRRNFNTLLGEVPGLIQNILVTLSKRVRRAEAALGR
jgi:CRP/FNR family transcriptional regulator/CRP/FNR family cyclic AMP-dependent transcriptional regulator